MSRFPVEQLDRRWGWKIEPNENLERIATVVAEGQPVGVYQDAGRRNWWEPFGGWPHHFERLTALPTQTRWEALLVISDQVLPEPPPELKAKTLVYRPPTLTLGIGCRRGVACEEIEACVARLFARHRLSRTSITALATVTLNKSEEGLIEFAEERQIPFLAYGTDKLALVGPLPTPSERVRSWLGVAGVCEPAAMLAASVKELIVPKTRFRRVSLAVARRVTA